MRGVYADPRGGHEEPVYLPLVLFCFTTMRRESSARNALRTHHQWRELRIATAAIPPDEGNPADAVWLPLALDSGPGMRLAALGEAVPTASLDPRPPRL